MYSLFVEVDCFSGKRPSDMNSDWNYILNRHIGMELDNSVVESYDTDYDEDGKEIIVPNRFHEKIKFIVSRNN